MKERIRRIIHNILLENTENKFLKNITYNEIDDFASIYGVTDDIHYVYEKLDNGGEIQIYRLLCTHNFEFDNNNLGVHWTTDSDVFGDENFIDEINLPLNCNSYIVLTTKVKLNSVDIDGTIENNSYSPNEFEITLKNGINPHIINVQKFNSLDDVKKKFREGYEHFYE